MLGLQRVGWEHRLMAVTFLLAIVGLMVQFSLSPTLAATHLIFICLGLALLAVFSRIELTWYQHLTRQIYLVLLGLMGITLALGVQVKGSSRWLDVGVLRFQPSELIKPFLIVLLARWLSQAESVAGRLKILGLMVVPLILVFLQPDLGTSLVLAFTSIAILIIYRPTQRLALGIVMVGLVASPILLNQLAPYQKERLLSFADPYADPLGSGYNVLQAQLAVGAGKILGKGLGSGIQSRLNFLPEKQTDFVFASLAEGMGFVGSIFLLGVIFFWFVCMWYLARNSQGEYPKLVILGLMILLMTQTFIHLGMNMGLLPVTGLTLPWLSAGGSSIISVSITLGMMLSAYQDGGGRLK